MDRTIKNILYGPYFMVNENSQMKQAFEIEKISHLTFDEGRFKDFKSISQFLKLRWNHKTIKVTLEFLKHMPRELITSWANDSYFEACFKVKSLHDFDENRSICLILACWAYKPAWITGSSLPFRLAVLVFEEFQEKSLPRDNLLVQPVRRNMCPNL